MTESKSLEQNDAMVIDEPDHPVAGSSACLIVISDYMAALPYEDEIELST